VTKSDLLIKTHLNLTVANGVLSGEVSNPVVCEEDVIHSLILGFGQKLRCQENFSIHEAGVRK
jgi:hypothetical protein